MTSSTLSAADAKLPLFVFPTSLYFYSDDPTSHRQLLTVYNPYNFPLKYKGKCCTLSSLTCTIFLTFKDKGKCLTVTQGMQFTHHTIRITLSGAGVIVSKMTYNVSSEMLGDS